MVKIIAEIGINHNGSLDIAKKLIDLASFSGCDFVKFQKRNPDTSTPEDKKNLIKNSIWGPIKYIDYKYKLEFDEKQYDLIDKYCKKKKISWFCSVWDADSVDFMSKYTDDHFGFFTKIPSAMILNLELIEYAGKKSDFFAISTGMSTEEEVAKAIDIGNPDVIFHTNSSYPTPNNEINLNYINWLKHKYPIKYIGYSGHENGFIPSLISVSMGVKWIERHITLDKSMPGSDQSSSLDPEELISFVKKVRTAEECLGEYGPRKITPSEFVKKNSLR